MAGRALPDLTTRLRLDPGDFTKGEQTARASAAKLAADLKKVGIDGGQNIGNVRTQLDHMIGSLQRSGQGSSAAATQMVALRGRVDEAAKSIGGAGKQTETATGHVSRLHSGLEKLGPVGASVSKRFDDLGLSTRVATGGLLAMAAAAVLAAGKLAHDAINAASNLNEQVSRTGVVFGSASGQMVKFAQTADASLGLSETAALNAASAFGGMFQNAGMTAEATAKMSTTLVGLSGDLASFMNLQGGSEEAAQKLTMGLTGQLDVLRELGIFISDVDVVNEVMRLGLEKTTAQITESDKVVARYNLILQKTGTAQGDFSRTSNQAANQQRILNAELANSQTEIGTGLLPAWNSLLGAGAELIGVGRGIQGAFAGASSATHGFTGRVAEVAGAGILPITALGTAIGKLSDLHGKGTATATNYAGAQAKASDIQRTYAAATKAAETAQQSLNDAILSAFDKDLAYQRSILASRDAVAQYNQATKDASAAVQGFGVNSQQTKDAQEALQKAQLDVQSSALSQAAAAVEAARQQHELAGQTFSARDAAGVEIQALQEVANTLAPGSTLRANIDAYIARLNSGIPREIQTHFEVIFSSSGAITTGGDTFIPRAAGGSLLPGHAYAIGEHGPELAVMGARGGMVLPGGSGPISVSNLSTARVERLLAQQNQLLAQIARAPVEMTGFSNAAYGS